MRAFNYAARSAVMDAKKKAQALLDDYFGKIEMDLVKERMFKE